MRLIGRPLLAELSETAGEYLRGSARALAAEMASADWKSSKEFRQAFPNARIDEHRIFVDLDQDHCALIIMNYERSVAMVEYAGTIEGFTKAEPKSTNPRRRK